MINKLNGAMPLGVNLFPGETYCRGRITRLPRKSLLARILALMFAATVHTQIAYADERQDLETLRNTTLNLIKMLVQQGVLKQETADQLIKDAEKTAAATAKDAPNVVRVPYVPESVKREIREQIKQEVLAQAKGERWGDPGVLPDWISRISWEGDLRLRFQKDFYQPTNPPPIFFNSQGVNISNTQDDRQRLRLRARLGMKANISDSISAGFGITTGSFVDPVSTNQTMGNYQNRYTIALDRAYLKADPYNWLSVSAGRIPNPFFSTDLIWDQDLNFDGVAATFKPKFGDQWESFFTAGVFPLQEIETTQINAAKDKWLAGAQAGVQWRSLNDSKLKLGVALYDYRNVHGQPNPTLFSTIYNATVPQFRQKGNSLFNIDNDGDPTTALFALAPKFRELAVTASYDWAKFDPLHVVLNAEYVRNIGYDREEILQRTGRDIEPQTKAYQAQLTIGHPFIKKSGEWQIFSAYKYLERDAVLDAFTDSDFHLGGTDAKGYIFGANYGIAKNTWLSFRWLSADEIAGPPNGLPLSIDVLQLDLNARF